jgi:hypothetical protein
MPDGAGWQECAISLEELMTGGGVLVARCGRPGCDAVTPLAARPLGPAARRASVPRLEAAVRCTCGWRRGTLAMLAALPERPGRQRCYLFHG